MYINCVTKPQKEKERERERRREIENDKKKTCIAKICQSAQGLTFNGFVT